MKKEDFVKVTSNYNSHLPLLWEALEATDGLVMEMGCGFGSTPFLSEYCKFNKRLFVSFENNKEWYKKLHDHFPEVRFTDDWKGSCFDSCYGEDPSVLFIDHAPGERRKIDIALHAKHAQIIVAHDTEPAADHGYKMRAELKKFKWMIDYETDGAWATAVSNFIDVTKFNL
jgi:hypothetical protein